jgi:hypothetical protein
MTQSLKHRESRDWWMACLSFFGGDIIGERMVWVLRLNSVWENKAIMYLDHARRGGCRVGFLIVPVRCCTASFSLQYIRQAAVHYYLNLWILFSFILTNHLVKSYRSASEYLKMVACLIVVRAGGKLTPQEQSQRQTGQSRRYNVTPIFLARLPQGIRHVEARGRFCTTILSGPESTDLWIIPLFSSLSKNYVVYSSHAASL